MPTRVKRGMAGHAAAGRFLTGVLLRMADRNVVHEWSRCGGGGTAAHETGLRDACGGVGVFLCVLMRSG